jgi:predicted metalloendopeptidase
VKLVLRTVDGFTPQQRSYLAFAEIWCENDREEALRLQVNTNPHAPAKDGVIGAAQNSSERYGG